MRSFSAPSLGNSSLTTLNELQIAFRSCPLYMKIRPLVSTWLLRCLFFKGIEGFEVFQACLFSSVQKHIFVRWLARVKKQLKEPKRDGSDELGCFNTVQ